MEETGQSSKTSGFGSTLLGPIRDLASNWGIGECW